MLPHKLYELLPIFYIFTGLACAVLIDFTMVMISSMLLILTGVFVLIMRRNFRKSSNRGYQQRQGAYLLAVAEGFERRSGNEQRQRKVTGWPIRDDAGNGIISDRRIGERRISTV